METPNVRPGTTRVKVIGEQRTRERSAWRELGESGRLPQFILLCLGVWLHAADTLVTATIMPAVVEEIGGVAYVNWTISLYQIGSIVAGAATGALSRRLGLRRMLIAAAASSSWRRRASAISPPRPHRPCSASATLSAPLPRASRRMRRGSAMARRSRPPATPHSGSLRHSYRCSRSAPWRRCDLRPGHHRDGPPWRSPGGFTRPPLAALPTPAGASRHGPVHARRRCRNSASARRPWRHRAVRCRS